MLNIQNGGVQSQNYAFSFNSGKKQDFGLHRGMIIKIRYVDQENLTKEGPSPRPLYDVITLGGREEGNIITNCRLMSDLGDNSNYAERVLKATTKSLITSALSEHDGTIVYFQFLNGWRDFPVIVGCDQGLATGSALGATEADGIRSIREFNGVREVIDKDGVLTINTAAGIAIRITDTTVFLGDIDAADFVANATKVNAEFGKIMTTILTMAANTTPVAALTIGQIFTVWKLLLQAPIAPEGTPFPQPVDCAVAKAA